MFWFSRSVNLPRPDDERPEPASLRMVTGYKLQVRRSEIYNLQLVACNSQLLTCKRLVNDHIIGVAAALGSAASWAVGTILFKGVGAEFSAMAMTLIKSFAGALLLFLLLLFVGWSPPQRDALGWLALSGLLGISVGDTFFFAALRRLGAHQLIIIMMLGPAITILMAVLILGELPTLLAWVGIVFVLGGVTLTFLGDSRTPEQPVTSRAGVVFGLLCILSMAASIIVAKLGLRNVSALEGTFLRMVSGCSGMLLIGALRRDLVRWLRPLRLDALRSRFALAVIVVTFGGFWLSLAAIKHLNVSIANTLIATEPLFALPLAVLWLGERPSRLAVTGACIAFPGALLLALNG
jgi:drug/metabolite transporter (DMT)-like permease